jgi:hypothetical protein
MAILEDREIDEWFEEQKERLAEQLYQELQRGADDSKARNKFDVAFRRLLDSYDEKSLAAEKARGRHERFAKPFRKIASWWQELLIRRALRRKRREELAKKRKFERQYRKLFPSEKKKL